MDRGSTCADAVRRVPQRAEVAVHAVGAERPPVAHVALAGPIPLSAAVSTAVAVPAAGPPGPTLALCGDTSIAQSAPAAARAMFSEKMSLGSVHTFIVKRAFWTFC